MNQYFQPNISMNILHTNLHKFLRCGKGEFSFEQLRVLCLVIISFVLVTLVFDSEVIC